MRALPPRASTGNGSATPRGSCFGPEMGDNGSTGGAQRRRAKAHPNITGCADHRSFGAVFEVGGPMDNSDRTAKKSNLSEAEEEAKKIRRLQMMMSMVMSVISQDPDLTIEEASEMAANSKRAALAMFPDKEFAYDILYKPRLQRLLNERFRIQ